MLYKILLLVIKIAIKVFYKKIQLKNAHFLKTSVPVIVVANHPNTFMDPILIALQMKQPLYFLSNGSVFTNKATKWLWKQFQMIPIYRQKDSIEGVDKGEANKKAFGKCFEFLSKKGSLLVFPEGSSIIERRLRDIKTGTARIALGAEFQNDFKLNLKILPIGLNYSNPEKFRSEVFMNVGEPISLEEFQEKYKNDNFKTVTELTEIIQTKLQELIIHIPDSESDKLTEKVEILYKNELLKEYNFSEKNKEEDFEIVQEIATAIELYRKENPDKIQELQNDITTYFQNLKRLNISDEVFAKRSEKNFIGNTLKMLFILFLGLPVYFFGVLNNYLPYILPSLIAKKATDEPEWHAPLMLMIGILTFSVAYTTQIWLSYHWLDNIFVSILYGVSLPITGFFVLYYWTKLTQWLEKWGLIKIFYRKSNLISDLIQDRKKIIKSLQEYKKKYLETL